MNNDFYKIHLIVRYIKDRKGVTVEPTFPKTPRQHQLMEKMYKIAQKYYG